MLFKTIGLLLFITTFIGGTIAFSLKLSNQQITLIQSSSVVSTFANVSNSLQNPIPAGINSIGLTFSSDVPSTGFNVTTSINVSPSTGAVPYFSFGSSFFSNGSTSVDQTLFINCSQSAIFQLTLNLIVSIENQTDQQFNVFINKQCSTATTQDPCDSCGSCVTSKTCDCLSSSNGYICSQRSSSSSTGSQDQLRIFSLNMATVGTNESDAAIQTRSRAILAKIMENDSPYDVISLQQLYSDDVRDIFIQQLRASYPYILSKSFGSTGANLDSGLFFASKLPIDRSTFAPFTTTLDQSDDSTFSKGILSSLVRVSTGEYLLIFSTELQQRLPLSLTAAAVSSTQSAQLFQLSQFINSEFKFVTDDNAASTVSVLLVGIPHTLVSTVTDALTSPVNMIASTSAASVTVSNCTSALAYRQGCTIGSSSVTLPLQNSDSLAGGNQMAISFETVNDADTRPLALIGTASLEFLTGSTSGPFGNLLSDSPVLDLTFDYGSSYVVAVAVVCAVIGVILIIIVSCLIHVYARHKPLPGPYWLQLYLRQSGALFKKNWLVNFRNRRAFFIQILFPWILMLIFFVLQFALTGRQAGKEEYQSIEHPVGKTVPLIPRCIIGYDRSDCYTLGFTPNNDSFAINLIEKIRIANNIPTSEIISFPTADAAQVFLLANPNSTNGFYHFSNIIRGANNEVVAVQYNLNFNFTQNYYQKVYSNPYDDVETTMQFHLQKELLNYRIAQKTNNSQQTFNFDVRVHSFPHPELISSNILNTAGPSFFIACLMFNLVIQLGQLVLEKELHLRQAMAVVGLRDPIYWFTWIVTNLLWNLYTALSLMAAGAAFQFDYFLKNDFWTYGVLFILFSFSLVPFTILISLFIGKNRTATTVGFAVYLIGALSLIAISFAFTEDAEPAVRIIFSLFPFILLGKGMNILSERTSGNATGLRWSDVDNTGFFTLADVYRWLAIDFAIFFVLSLLIDYLFGGVHEESRARKFISSLIKTKAQPVFTEEELKAMDQDIVEETKRVRKDNESHDTRMILQDLRKTYKNFKYGVIPNHFTAVKGTNVVLETGKLFCLLGQNGAGKSTTISMLTGILEPTSGDASIFGQSLVKDIDSIRKDMGVCPQYDLLWSELTAAEHIELFSALKGMDYGLWKEEMKSRLTEVNLFEDRQQQAGSMSGGAKRRLSVAIALCGNPKVVFLDEPCTGMDPVSRRHVWNLLEDQKKKRLIVLTTHSMEEADMLGDRIAIMKKGEVMCLGTSLHLKHKYGSGLALSLVTKDTPSLTQVQALMKELVPTAKLSREPTPDTVNFEIPTGISESVPSVLKELEENSEKLGLVDIQIGLTSLEDVFFRVAGLEKELEEEEEQKLNEAGKTEADEGEGDKAQVADKDEREPSSTWTQFAATMQKQLVLIKRQWKTNLCNVVLPLFLLVVVFLFQLMVTNTIQSEYGQYSSQIDSYVQPSSSLTTADFDVSDNTQCPELTAEAFSRLYSGITLDLDSGKFLYGSASDAVGSYGLQPLSLSQWDPRWGLAQNQPAGLIGNFSHLSDAMLGYKQQINIDNNIISYTQCQTRLYRTPFDFQSQVDRESLEDTLFGAWGQQTYAGAYFFEAANLLAGNLNVSIYVNRSLTQSKDFGYVSGNLFYAIWQTLGPSTANQAFPYDFVYFEGIRDYPSAPKENDFDIITLLGPVFFVFIFHLLFPVFLSGLVSEKELKLREIMKMMGLKTHVYWIVNYIQFFFIFIISSLVLLGIAAAVGFRVVLYNDFALWIILLICWCNLLISAAFFFSVFFGDSRTSTVFGYVMIFAIGLISNQVIDPYFTDPGTTQSVLFGLSVFPSFAMYRGLVELFDAVGKNGLGLSASQLTGNAHALGEVYIFLLCESFVLMVLAAYFETVIPSGFGVKRHPLFFLQPSFWIKKKPTTPTSSSDVKIEMEGELSPEVKEEAEKTLSPENKSFLRLLKLRKIYPVGGKIKEKVAVKGLTMSAETRSCFGLLGPNGSGKSSTMNMLGGYFQPTAGTALIGGLDITVSTAEIQTKAGVCLQELVVWPELTAKDHLRLFGRLKNLSGKSLDEEIKYRLQQVDLYAVRNKKAGAYSGGMKRRLCVAIALIGSPDLVLFDEPTTGLDPRARFNLWSVIRKAKKHSTVMLTTHSMEEAEALCDRVGILVDGQLRSVGTPALLKHSFGKFLRLSITTKPENEKKLTSLLVGLCPETVLTEIPTQGTFRYQLPKDSVKLSQLFATVNGWIKSEEIQIFDWAVANVSLEEVFLAISGEGKELKEMHKDHKHEGGKEEETKANKFDDKTNTQVEVKIHNHDDSVKKEEPKQQPEKKPDVLLDIPSNTTPPQSKIVSTSLEPQTPAPLPVVEKEKEPEKIEEELVVEKQQETQKEEEQTPIRQEEQIVASNDETQESEKEEEKEKEKEQEKEQEEENKPQAPPEPEQEQIEQQQETSQNEETEN